MVTTKGGELRGGGGGSLPNLPSPHTGCTHQAPPPCSTAATMLLMLPRQASKELIKPQSLRSWESLMHRASVIGGGGGGHTVTLHGLQSMRQRLELARASWVAAGRALPRYIRRESLPARDPTAPSMPCGRGGDVGGRGRQGTGRPTPGYKPFSSAFRFLSSSLRSLLCDVCRAKLIVLLMSFSGVHRYGLWFREA